MQTTGLGDLADPAGQEPEADAIARARAAVYGPGASPRDVAELDRLLGARAAEEASGREPSRVAAAPSETVVTGAARARRWFRLLIPLAAVTGVAVLLLVRPGRLTAPVPTTAADGQWRAAVALVVGSRGGTAADRAFEQQPDRLPPAWRDRPAPISFLELDGRQAVTMPDSTSGRVLLTVACGTADRTFRWRVRPGIAHGTGICGRLVPIEVRVPADRTLQVRIRTAGSEPFSLTTYRR